MEEMGWLDYMTEVELESARRLTGTGFEEMKGAEGAKGGDGAGMVIGV